MNNHKRFLTTKASIFLAFASLIYSVNAQEMITITGKVVDANSNKPLAFSTINILGTSSGVVSNFLGEFELNIPAEHTQDSIYVSILGHEPYKASIESLGSYENLTIALNESIVMLEEVEVNEKEISALDVVNKVIEKIPENYPITPYLLEGFTRSHKKECGKYVTLHEAVFNLYGQGYHKKNQERIYFKESRQSEYTPYYHSRVLRNNRNLFISMSHINDVLYRSYSLQTKNNTYEIDKYAMLDDQLVYVIKTTQSSFVTHTMYINADDLALLKVTMDMDTPKDVDWNPYLNKGPSSDSLDFQVTRISKTIQFEKRDDRYFTKYMDWNIEGKLYQKDTRNEFCDWGFRFETMFDKVFTENFEKPGKENLMNPKSRKDPPSTPYNASFWESYPLIQEFPITPQIVDDLEVNDPLEVQFDQSAKNQ